MSALFLILVYKVGSTFYHNGLSHYMELIFWCVFPSSNQCGIEVCIPNSLVYIKLVLGWNLIDLFLRSNICRVVSFSLFLLSNTIFFYIDLSHIYITTMEVLLFFYIIFVVDYVDCIRQTVSTDGSEKKTLMLGAEALEIEHAWKPQYWRWLTPNPSTSRSCL